MKLKFIPFLVALFAFETGFAQDSAAVKKPVVAKLKAYKDIITAKATSKNGLFKVHKVDEKYYFEIPDSLLSREFLFTTRLSKVATGSPKFGGEMMNAMIVSFEKAPNDKLFVRAITNVAQSNPTDIISRAVRNATIEPIIMVLDLKTRGTDNKSSVIDMTDFFMKDNMISGFNAEAKKQMGTGAPAADRSMLLSMDAYPENIEIKSLKTYTIGAAPAAAAGPDGPAAPGAGPASSVGVTFEISNSVMAMPKVPMSIQVYDPRVGYYNGSYQVFSDAQQQVETNRFIVRNRLEVKPQDMARYKAGGLVEPKNPLVYYVDPATPKQWRQYIIAGVNDWNEAFKGAGFKNAIVAKEWPENDKSMNIEDARYRVIRYFPSVSPFVVAPRLSDPRTGEILQAYIGWSHSQVKTLHDWYMIQAGAADPNGRTMKFSNELMGALIRAEISRNVGFNLGLRENLGSSSTIPIAQLRDKKWLEKNPFNHSIMDLNFYNYVAQPEDMISRNGLIPKIGVYDKWAIKWGYTYTGAKDFESDKKIRLKWILDNVKSGSKLWYGTITAGTNPSDPFDPSVQWADLSNDPIKASEYGVKNLKFAMANLLKWADREGDTYYTTSDLYYTLCDQFSFLIRHVYSNVGGVHTTIKSVEEDGDVFKPVAKATQKAAVAFMNREVFNTPTWIFDPNILNKFSKPAKKEQYQKMQDNALSYLIHSPRLFRMNAATMRYGAEAVYTVDNLFTDLNNGLWAEVKSHKAVDSYKRILQKAAIGYMIKSAQDGEKLPDLSKPGLEELAGTDVPVVLQSHLKLIMDQCNAAIPAYKDQVMVAHLKYISARIAKYLDVEKSK
ncbi:zinc-dependent metalloprotease [Pedobacter nyackensis]|uniref:Zinc-dependent metalloprotease n=1 Tax=Pedobacter nyackensis TaxID=475255 RepID=A0A1W2CQH1_9SPHI|nr:zinc-dependent metalloprotease [Pedobacter nyackensis]SMC87451.1 protein of unknown function [Pedobacter nyackensis]